MNAKCSELLFVVSFVRKRLEFYFWGTENIRHGNIVDTYECRFGGKANEQFEENIRKHLQYFNQIFFFSLYGNSFESALSLLKLLKSRHFESQKNNTEFGENILPYPPNSQRRKLVESFFVSVA